MTINEESAENLTFGASRECGRAAAHYQCLLESTQIPKFAASRKGMGLG
jgi:hypothetical protein